MRLAGRNALVTGGGRGIGRAIALGLAREGANVVVNYHRSVGAAEAVAAAIQDLGRKSLALQADVADRTAVERMASHVRKQIGCLDILVNNAGILFRRPLIEIGDAEWDEVFRVNCRGCFIPTQVIARDMIPRRTGSIINITSSAQARPPLHLAHYAPSKAAVASFTKCAALELAPFGIRVNAIAPGVTETDINREDLRNPAFCEMRLKGIPLGKIASPEDMVGAAIYLASDESALVTGSILYVDAGATI